VILKSHLCGIAVAYGKDEPIEGGNSSRRFEFNNESLKNGRPQGSLYSQQKRKIADACEFMRLNATHKPIIFVATSPGFTNHANEKQIISKLTHNLRNGYDCRNYVWVREFTKAGFPHFHFVADMPDFDCVSLSLYWSRLFGVDAPNSIRLGTRPKNGKRQFYLKGKRMSWYLTKYLGKAIGDPEKGSLKFKREFRTFAVSQELAKLSTPTFYESMTRTTETKKKNSWAIEQRTESREWVCGDTQEILTDEKLLSKWNWKYTGFANTFKGYPKEWKLKKP
jgi:hypothetical protein